LQSRIWTRASYDPDQIFSVNGQISLSAAGQEFSDAWKKRFPDGNQTRFCLFLKNDLAPHGEKVDRRRVGGDPPTELAVIKAHLFSLPKNAPLDLPGART
jgi:hypothetical protein